MTPGASFTFQWSTYISWTLMTSTSRQWWVVMISHFDVTVTYMYTLILSESIEIICSSDTLTWVRTKFRSIGLHYNMHMGAISVHHSNIARTTAEPAFSRIDAWKSWKPSIHVLTPNFNFFSSSEIFTLPHFILFTKPSLTWSTSAKKNFNIRRLK